MPEFYYEPQTASDPSNLSEGMHPAFLVCISDEPTPPTWEMFKKSPRLWRWHFAVWQLQTDVQGFIPELQTAVTSQTFSPGGRYQASKAYVWTGKILNRQIAASEHINLDPMLPLACQVWVERKDRSGTPIAYANIKELVYWDGGQALLTAELRQRIAEWHASKMQQPGQQGQAPTAQPNPAPQPPSSTSMGNAAAPPSQPQAGQPAAAPPTPPPAPAPKVAW
jgi:hypothetical protein